MNCVTFKRMAQFFALGLFIAGCGQSKGDPKSEAPPSVEVEHEQDVNVVGVDHPEKAVSLGEYVVAKDVWETPDTVQTVLQYPGGIQMHFEGTFANAREGAHIVFMGTEANLYIDRGAYVVTPELRSKAAKADQQVLSTEPKHRGADFYDQPDGELLHLTNWVESIKSRKPPTAPAEGGVGSSSAAHLANQALRNGGSATWKG